MTSKQNNECVFCKETFDDKEQLQQHFRKHGDPNFNQNKTNRQQNDSHNKTNNESDMVECDACSEVFPTISKAITHKHKVHPDLDAKYFCPWCGKLFTLKFLYNKHIQTSHDEAKEPINCKEFYCNCCEVDFYRPSAMLHHNKFFHRQDTELASIGQSKKQKMFHQDILQLFYCVFCGEEYNNKVNLHKHMSDDHGDENQSPSEVLRCPLCEAIFYHLDAYELHLTFHSTDDLYIERNDITDSVSEFTLETVPPIMETVEDYQPEEETEETANAIENLFQMAMLEENENDKQNKKSKKHKKHKKSKKAAITFDEFLNMNKDVFGEGLDVQGIEEVPTQVVAKQLKSRKIQNFKHQAPSSELEKLKKQGIIVKKKPGGNSTVLSGVKVKQKPIGLVGNVNSNQNSRITNKQFNIPGNSSNSILSKLMSQCNNQIKIIKKSVVNKDTEIFSNDIISNRNIEETNQQTNDAARSEIVQENVEMSENVSKGDSSIEAMDDEECKTMQDTCLEKSVRTNENVNSTHFTKPYDYETCDKSKLENNIDKNDVTNYNHNLLAGEKDSNFVTNIQESSDDQSSFNEPLGTLKQISSLIVRSVRTNDNMKENSSDYCSNNKNTDIVETNKSIPKQLEMISCDKNIQEQNNTTSTDTLVQAVSEIKGNLNTKNQKSIDTLKKLGISVKSSLQNNLLTQNSEDESSILENSSKLNQNLVKSSCEGNNSFTKLERNVRMNKNNNDENTEIQREQILEDKQSTLHDECNKTPNVIEVRKSVDVMSPENFSDEEFFESEEDFNLRISEPLPISKSSNVFNHLTNLTVKTLKHKEFKIKECEGNSSLDKEYQNIQNKSENSPILKIPKEEKAYNSLQHLNSSITIKTVSKSFSPENVEDVEEDNHEFFDSKQRENIVAKKDDSNLKAGVIKNNDFQLNKSEFYKDSNNKNSANIKVLKNTKNDTAKSVLNMSPTTMKPKPIMNISKLNTEEKCKKMDDDIEIFSIDDSDSDEKHVNNESLKRKIVLPKQNPSNSFNKNINVNSVRQHATQKQPIDNKSSNLLITKTKQGTFRPIVESNVAKTSVSSGEKSNTFQNMLNKLSEQITIKSRNPSKITPTLCKKNENDSDISQSKIKTSESIEEYHSENEDLYLNDDSKHSGSLDDEYNDEDFSDMESEINASVLQKPIGTSPSSSTHFKNLTKINNVSMLNDNQTKVIPLRKNLCQDLTIKSSNQIHSNENPDNKTSDFVNQIDSCSMETSNLNTQTSSVNKDVSVKTYQTQTVIEEITTTVTKTIRTVNKAVSEDLSSLSDDSSVNNVSNASSNQISPSFQKVVQRKIMKSCNTFEGGIVRNPPLNITNKIRNASPANMMSTSVKLPQTSQTVRCGLNVIRQNRPSTPNKTIPSVTKLPRTPIVGKPLRISPHAIAISSKKQDTAVTVNPSTVYKKITQSSSTVSKSSAGGPDKDTNSIHTTSAKVSKSNFTSVTGNTVMNSTQIKSDVRRNTCQQLGQFNAASGSKIIKSDQTKSYVTCEKSESNIYKRTTNEAIEMLQKKGLLVKKPRITEVTEDDYSDSENEMREPDYTVDEYDD